jgi:hypothetical protein
VVTVDSSVLIAFTCSFCASGQLRTGLHHVLVGPLQQAGILGRHGHGGAVVVHRLDPREELGIEVDRVRVRRELRPDLGIDRVQRVVGVRASQGVEHRRHPAEHLTRRFQGDEGVLEGRRGGLVADAGDLDIVRFHRLVESGQVVGVLHLGEVWRAQRQGADLREVSGRAHHFFRAARVNGGSSLSIGARRGGRVGKGGIVHGGASGQRGSGQDDGRGRGKKGTVEKHDVSQRKRCLERARVSSLAA